MVLKAISLRPAVVVQDTELLDLTYPTVLVVPMTGNPAMVIHDLTVVLQPSRIRAAPSVGGVDHRVTASPLGRGKR